MNENIVVISQSQACPGKIKIIVKDKYDEPAHLTIAEARELIQDIKKQITLSSENLKNIVDSTGDLHEFR